MPVEPIGSPNAFEVRRWTEPLRLDEILAVVHRAFDNLDPPSGVLAETIADIAARQHRGPIFVAMHQESMIGSVFVGHHGDALDLTRLAVLPAWRGRGIGAALVAAVAEEADRAGAARLTLRVRQSLPGNLGYFRKLGFIVTGAGQDAGRAPYDALERRL